MANIRQTSDNHNAGVGDFEGGPFMNSIFSKDRKLE